MFGSALRIAVTALSAAGVAAAAPMTPPAVGAKTVRDDRFPATRASFADGIVAEPHVEFANFVGYRPLQLDLYRHVDSTIARPLVIWIHGGGWSRGDSRQSGAFQDWPGVLAALAAHGYVVASVDYRLSGEAPFPAPVQDIKAAIRYLRAHAGDYRIDPAKVFLWGGSAGGHLAAMTALTCGIAKFDPPASTGRLPGSAARSAQPLAQSDCVQGAAIWYGAFDLAPHEDGGSALTPKNLTALLGCAPVACPATAAAASPIFYVKRDEPPLLLMHGTADDEVATEQTRAFAARVRKAGAQAETVYLDGANHGWIGQTPEQTRDYSLRAWRASVDFFDRLAGKAR
jgi:acetyl esterase/lipase